jgi:hypothetical protein
VNLTKEKTMSDNMPAPDFIDVSPEVQAAASAAAAPKFVWTPPATAKRTAAKSDPKKVYERWSESVVVEGAWRERTDSGLISATVYLKSRAGMPNEHQRVFIRHFINTNVLVGTATEEENKKHQGMTDRSIHAITTLLSATGFAPTEGGLTGKLLNYLFPVKGQAGAVSPLRGKAVVANLVNSPNTKEGATETRQTGAESYLPDSE